MKTAKKKSFLVTGGSGFLGINLIRYLVDKGHRVISYDISDFLYTDVKDKISIVQGDICDRRLLTKVMKGVDVVVHAAAALPLYPEKEIFRVNVKGTSEVLRVAHTQRVERVVFISSTSVYGIPEHHPIYEDDALLGVGFYGESKIQAESICKTYRKKGMCVPILRPKTFVGPERLGVFSLLYEWASDAKHFPLLGNGKNHYQLLDVEDLAQAIYSASVLECNKVNSVFNIGARDYGTIRNDFQAVLDKAGFGKHIILIPSLPVIIILRLFEVLGLSPLYQWIYETVDKESSVSIEKASQILHFQPRFSNKEALIRNYTWYLQHRREFEQEVGISHRLPWKQGILRIAKVLFS